MRILIDATTAQEGGGVTYLSNILPALTRCTEVHDYDVLLSSVYQQDLVNELPQGINGVARRVPKKPLARWLYLQALIPRLLRANRYDLLFSIADISAAYTPCPRVVLVTNESLYASLKSFPKLSQRFQHLKYRMSRQPLAYLTVRGADRVIFVSESSRTNVRSRLAVPIDRTRVIHHGLNPRFHSAGQAINFEQVLETRPYILTVTSLSQHKNLEALLRGFARIVRSGRYEDLQLLVVGPAIEDSVLQFLMAESRRLGIDNRVSFTGHVNSEQLVPIYQKAKVFVLPSRFETFALPLVEAMACGVPVAAADLPVCREVCREAALYFPPENADVLASQVMKILDDSAVAQNMSRNGLQRATNFSWDIAAQKLVRVFEEVGPVH